MIINNIQIVLIEIITGTIINSILSQNILKVSNRQKRENVILKLLYNIYYVFCHVIFDKLIKKLFRLRQIFWNPVR